MNKRGFTLVELLAVIIILTLLALLTSTAVTKLVKDSKQDLSDAQKELIKSAAEIWGADNLAKLPETGGCGYLTLSDLKEYGLIDSNVLEPNNSQPMLNDLKIKITATTSSYGNVVTNYELTEDIQGCTKIYDTICTAVSTPTTGNKATGEYLPGDEYTCEVKPGTSYTFFVLSTEGNKVNLILEKNICSDGTLGTESSTADNCHVPWISGVDYEMNNIDGSVCNSIACVDEGPITALNFLNQATATWSNIENFHEKYVDERYEIVLNGKTRLPKYSELENVGCTTVEDGICPIWVINYLYQNVNPAYWTLTTTTSNTKAMFLYRLGSVMSFVDCSAEGHNGVRPVITVSKYRIQN